MSIFNYIVDFSSLFIIIALVGDIVRNIVETTICTTNDLKLDADGMMKNLKATHSFADKMYDVETINKTLEYNKIRSLFSAMKTCVFSPVMLLLTILGFNAFILDSLLATGWHTPACLALSFMICVIASTIIGIPFDLYDDKIEKKFGYSNLTLSTYFADLIKSIVVSCIVLTTFTYLAYYALMWIGKLNIFTTLLFVTGAIIAEWILSMAYIWFIYPLFNKFTPLEDGELKTKLKSLVEGMGLKFENVYVMDESKRSTKGNAFCVAVPFGPQRIVLFDTLIKDLTVDEIVAVFAHEFAHKKLKHSQLNHAISYITMIIFTYISVFFLYDVNLYHAFGYKFVTDANVIEFSIVGFMLIKSVISGVSWLYTPIDSAISRACEYAADKYATAYTNDANSLITGLIKLNAKSNSDCIPTKLCETYFYSHPSLANRILALTTNK